MSAMSICLGGASCVILGVKNRSSLGIAARGRGEACIVSAKYWATIVRRTKQSCVDVAFVFLLKFASDIADTMYRFFMEWAAVTIHWIHVQSGGAERHAMFMKIASMQVLNERFPGGNDGGCPS